MAENILMIPEKRISAAKSTILRVVPNLDLSNVFGIAGFGSFWSKDIKRKALDIDIAVFVQNDAVFNDGDRASIETPLQSTFGIGVESHIITPYTVMVTHEVKNYKILLKERVPIWGVMPDWIK